MDMVIWRAVIHGPKEPDTIERVNGTDLKLITQLNDSILDKPMH